MTTTIAAATATTTAATTATATTTLPHTAISSLTRWDDESDLSFKRMVNAITDYASSIDILVIGMLNRVQQL
jgi:hypothetical protein